MVNRLALCARSWGGGSERDRGEVRETQRDRSGGQSQPMVPVVAPCVLCTSNESGERILRGKGGK